MAPTNLKKCSFALIGVCFLGTLYTAMIYREPILQQSLRLATQGSAALIHSSVTTHNVSSNVSHPDISPVIAHHLDKSTYSTAQNVPQNNPTVRVCIPPVLHPFEGDFYSKFFKEVNPIKCAKDADWVETSNGSVYLSNRFRNEQRKSIKCNLQYITRVNDSQVKYSDNIPIPTDSKMPLKHDYFKVSCTGHNRTYTNIHPAISYKPEIHARKSIKDISKGLGLDVLIISFDSMSRMTYMRKLKKTYKFIQEALKGYVLKNFNAIGDGTGENLTPLLTGTTEDELPIALKTHPRGQHVDVWPFIWQDMRKYGYVTAYLEDFTKVGTYTLRLKGFKKQPTDHFMRTFYLAAEPTYRKNKKLCLGSRRRSQVMFDYIKQFYLMYKNKPKFMFAFHGEMSHDSLNLVQTADEDLVELITFLKDNGYLNNTMLILGSDHGKRFGSSRAHPQGKLEQLLPFFSISFPPWFKNKYPDLINNLKINTETLTTGFDVHAMLEDMLNFRGGGIGDLNNRGISLFKQVPFNRTCKHANVSEDLCACTHWKEIKTTDARTQKVVNFTVGYFNNLTANYRNECEILSLQSVKSALIKSHGPSAEREVYQIQLFTSPGNGLFEVTVRNDKKKNAMTIDGTVSRINKYGDASKCIFKKNIDLRKFCYCKNYKPTVSSHS